MVQPDEAQVDTDTPRTLGTKNIFLRVLESLMMICTEKELTSAKHQRHLESGPRD